MPQCRTARAISLEPEEAERPLSEQHRTELTTYRTMALREALADDPEAAFVAVLHAMVIRVIVTAYRSPPAAAPRTRGAV